jgi:competence protein ComEC
MRNRFGKFLHQYPAVVTAVSLGTGAMGATWAGSSPNPLWMALLAVVLVTWSCAFRNGPGVCLWLAVAATFSLLGFVKGSRALTWGMDLVPPTSKIIVHATVHSTLASGPDFRILLLKGGTDTAQAMPLPRLGRLVLRNNDVSLRYGDRIAFSSRIRKPLNRGNPGEYNWELHCRNNNIGWLASVRGKDSVVVLRHGPRWDPRALLFLLRQRMSRFLTTRPGNHFSEGTRQKVRAILKGIILGDRGELYSVNTTGADQPVRESFADSGLAHMLSASGLHVGIVVLITLACIRIGVRIVPGSLLWLPFKKIGAIAAIPAILAYCLIVGSRIPTMRATVMGVVVAAAILLDRKWSSFNTLALAGTLILMMHPLSLFSPGFQLSFAAVAGILVSANPLWTRLYGAGRRQGENSPSNDQTRYRTMSWRLLSWSKRKAFGLLVTTVVAGIAVAPFVLTIFHRVPTYSVPSNLLASIMLTGALFFGLPATLVGTVLPLAGDMLLIPAELSVWCILQIALFFSSLPGSTVSVGYQGTTQFVLTLMVASTALWCIREPTPRRFWATAGVIVLVAGTALTGEHWNSDKGWLKATFLNVGNADAAFIAVPRAKGIMIDGGNRTKYFDSGRSIVVPFLRWKGVRALDGVIATHPQSDHVGGLPTIVEEALPSRLWCNLIDVPSRCTQRLLNRSRFLGIPVEEADRTCQPVKLGSATLVFLNKPCRGMHGSLSSQDVNNTSVVFRIAYGDVSFLFTGDLLQEGEDEILASGLRLDATVLKVGHHGGKGSSTERFLSAVRPAVAVISADYPPRRGLPNGMILKRLSSRGIKVYWTGRDGAVSIETDGKSTLRVTTGRGSRDTVKLGSRTKRRRTVSTSPSCPPKCK